MSLVKPELEQSAGLDDELFFKRLPTVPDSKDWRIRGRMEADMRTFLDRYDWVIKRLFGQETGEEYDFLTAAEGHKIYLDADIVYDAYLAFILLRDDEPLAVIGFEQYPDGVDIIQVQGAVRRGLYADAKNYERTNKSRATQLARIGDWRAKMFLLAEMYAESREMDYSWVLPGRLSPWRGPFSVERAESIYDATAQSLGYRFDSLTDRWTKVIGQPRGDHSVPQTPERRIPEEAVVNPREEYISKALPIRPIFAKIITTENIENHKL